LGRRGGVLAAVVVALLSACSSGDPSVDTQPTTAAPTTQAPASTAPATTSPGATTPPTTPAVGGLPVGVIWDYAKQEEFRPFLEQLSGGATWYELEWCQVQPDPAQPINWDRADKNIGRATSVGIKPMIRIRVGSCWATGGEKIDAGRGGLGYSVSTMPVDDAAYQDFVRSVVERYQAQGVDTYALENEVNGEGFWRGSAADYEALVRSGAEAIRSTDPDATVTDAGLSSTVWGVVMAKAALDEGRDAEAIATYQEYYERRFARREKDFPRAEDADQLREALATAQSTRNQEFAEATFRLADDGVIDTFQLHFYERWTNVPTLLSFLKGELPPGMAIDVWEAGLFWPEFDGDEQLVAAETAQLVYMLLGNGASRVIYLPMQSNTANTGDEIRFGLLDAEFRPRAGFDVIAGLADFTRQGGVTWQDVAGQDGSRTVVGSGPTGAQGLAWANGTPIPLQAPEVTISSLDGQQSAPATGVDLTEEPVVATAPTAADVAGLVA
jgi:hypothetical protein